MEQTKIIKHEATVVEYTILDNDNSRVNMNFTCTPEFPKKIETSIDGYNCTVNNAYKTYINIKEIFSTERIMIKFSSEKMYIKGYDNKDNNEVSISRSGIKQCSKCLATDLYPSGEVGDKKNEFCPTNSTGYVIIECKQLSSGSSVWSENFEECKVPSTILFVKEGYTTFRFPFYLDNVEKTAYTPSQNEKLLMQFIISFNSFIETDNIGFDSVYTTDDTLEMPTIVVIIRLYVLNDYKENFIPYVNNYINNGNFNFALRKKDPAFYNVNVHIDASLIELVSSQTQEDNQPLIIGLIIALVVIVIIVIALIIAIIFINKRKHNQKKVDIEMNTTDKDTSKPKDNNNNSHHHHRHHHSRHHDKPTTTNIMKSNPIDESIPTTLPPSPSPSASSLQPLQFNSIPTPPTNNQPSSLPIPPTLPTINNNNADNNNNNNVDNNNVDNNNNNNNNVDNNNNLVNNLVNNSENNNNVETSIDIDIDIPQPLNPTLSEDKPCTTISPEVNNSISTNVPPSTL
ncbi:hypothetical protein WA158_001240 [Blastocystis sp. Blastoise]